MSINTPPRPSTTTPPDTIVVPDEPRAPQDALGRGRVVSLLTAAVALSMAASLLTVSIGRDDTPAPEAAAVTDTTPAAQPAAPSGGSAAPAAEPRTAPVIARDPADVGSPIGDRGPTTVSVELETMEVEGQLADGTAYTYWTFGGTVPGPMVRVREGDTVELTLSNSAESANIHSIDLHAVNGPGGGAVATQVPPGDSRSFSFTPLNPGVYVYHCATPHIPSHIANGMYGLVVVEPEGGLPPVDRELYVMQGEIYTAEDRGAAGLVTYDGDKMIAEDPTYVVFNGGVAALTGDAAMTANVGERVRLFVGNGGPNLTSSFHVIGEVFDSVAVEGGSLINRDVQTTLIPAGGATWVEFTIDQPGDYLLVDHAITRSIDKGALAIISAEGTGDPAVYSVPEGQEVLAVDPHDTSGGHAGTAGAVEVTMTEFAFELPATLPAGETTFRVVNAGLAPHQFALTPLVAGGDSYLADSGDLAAGETVELTADLEPGTYDLTCHIPGHAQAGMTTTIEVTG